MVDLTEKLFTVQELAKTWRVSDDTVRRLVRDEPDILDFGKQSRRKRRYRPIRIPQHVAARVYERLQKGGQR